MRTLLLTCLFAIVLTTLHAQEVIKLWPDGQIPNAIAGVPDNEKAEMGADGIARISNVSTPTLTVYKPAGKPTGSAVMICPGGGYGILASGHEGEDIARWLNGMGVTAFVLKYRLPNEKLMTSQQEVPLMDAMQAMTLIRQKAGQYGIDTGRIGVMGFSAGGHLASTLATHYNKGPKANEQAKPNFAILIYPVITFGENTHSGSKNNLLGKLSTSPEMVAYYSNELQVTSQTPPTFLVHSEDDKAVPVQNSIDFYLACLKNNVPAEMHLYPKGGHGYGLRTAKYGSLNTWPDTCKAWLTALGAI
ncbi:alpha/beta hydrolase [Spirosoma rhododendri]|uniref:Alpha/beta hydrolase n=1 Tax=Spirosoma rhododendri TaxID=2728024 RepID=A0A7L5DQX1_9BACT|nr:alpha/beta hydrolase [Spirosoma rhododendri]QJD78377.1 alpha/beta hydrolase [Spirosoma rhododendri]